ncbi:Hypoxanthine-guanine phosphoribosyltransferase [Poriferisphaera corsica]|uniref:Hypoxanthine-guanine phosphoribosyltransferase n=2 Tax=Poriferisphaera corsica TaxID=2528020 RepID=A0A517YW97_9BACT|nr:Hypoxanthine-guanine phosphoribosyltransferase [Poriferisphaera corsica]
MKQDIERVLITRQEIDQRLDELAKQIYDDIIADSPSCPDNGTPIIPDITLVPILTGSIIFVADLIRRLPLKMQIRVMSVTSYPGTATSTKGASVEAALTRLPERLDGHHVLIIDDILDSGNTLKLVKEIIAKKNPATLRSCMLLRKQRPEALAEACEYIAFDIPDEFVIGYGLDYDDYYRNLPEICTLKPEVYENDL